LGNLRRSRRHLCLFYAAVALLALAGTWHQNLSYFRADDGWLLGFGLATVRFWKDTLVSAASTSIVIDFGLLLVALFALMIIEARRTGVRFVWLYIVLGLAIAISVTFPLFLIARERRLAAHEAASEPLRLTAADIAGLVALSGAMAVFTVWTLRS
jgi:Protein of unknown function DUF2834